MHLLLIFVLLTVNIYRGTLYQINLILMTDVIKITWGMDHGTIEQDDLLYCLFVFIFVMTLRLLDYCLDFC